MSGTVIALIVVVVVLGAAAVVLSTASRRQTDAATGRTSLSRESLRRDRAARAEAAAAAAAERPPTGREVERLAVAERGTELEPVGDTTPAPWTPVDPETYDASRRAFLNRSIVGLMILGISGFAAASMTAFLWPTGASGFGSRIRVGAVSDVIDEIRANNGFLYQPEGRMWLTEYPASALQNAEQVYGPQMPGLRAGVMALWQTCPHLGCRVPSCLSSQWFECPCHGSQYNQAGEYKGGPAPRGMDSFATEVSGGVLTVDTGQVIDGTPIGTNTTGQEAEGPSCVGSADADH